MTTTDRSDTVFQKTRFDLITLIGGLLMLLDTTWGIAADLGLDWSRTNEVVLGVSLALGLPAYLLDLWTTKRLRVPVFLLGLFIFRWLARCFGGTTFVLCNPLRGSVLLIVAFALLQYSSLRKVAS
jgi:hypothetical protein